MGIEENEERIKPADWLVQGEAEAVSGVSRRTLNRLVETGKLRRVRYQRVWRYSRQDCERISDLTSEAEAELAEKEATSRADKAEVQEDPDRALLTQAYGFIGTLMGPSRQLGEMLRDENRALRERCAQLEARHDELVRAREAFINEQHERELAIKLAESAERRKDRAIDGIVNRGLPLLAASRASSQFVASITDEQVALLLDTDLLSEQQKTLVRSLLGDRIQKEEPSDEQ